MHRLLLLCLLATGCGDGKDPAPVGPSGSASVKACAKSDVVRERLAPIDVEVSRVPIPEGLSLPRADRGARVPDGGMVVAVSGAAFLVDGKEVKAEEAAALVERRKQMLRESGMKPLEGVALALDAPKLDPTQVASFLRGLGEGTALYVLASPPDARREPVPKALEKGFSSLDSMQRAGALAVELKRALGRCPQASDFFERLAGAEPAARAPLLKNKLPEEVAACGCAVSDDLPELVAFALAADPPVVGKHVVLARSGANLAVGPASGQAFYDALPSGGAALAIPSP
jgi:hypothetical protein